MSTLQELPVLLKRAIRRHQVPGASIAVLRNNRIVAEAAAGVLNLDTRVSTTTDSVFQIGSISKTLTATLIMQLVDQGKLDLDTPVQHYLPEFRVADPGISREVTARHLLSHQSGIDGDFFVDSGRGDSSIEQLLTMATMLPNLFPIGAMHSYCNFGFALLGRIIEVLCNRSFDQVLKERIFEPLGMDHALSLPEDTLRFRCAIGHVPSSRRPNHWYVTRTPYLSFGQKAAGSTPSMSAGDLLKFARMHMHDGRNEKGERILKSGSVKAMQRRAIRVQKHTQNAIRGWGLGWFLMDWDGTRLYGHDGATIGQFAFLRILPDKGLAIALLTNGGDAKALYEELFGSLFSSLAKVQEPAAEVSTPAKVDFERHEGVYSNITGSLTFSRRGGIPVVCSSLNGGGSAFPDNSRLARIDNKTFALCTGKPVLDRTRFLFSDEVAGKFQFVANGLRQHKRLYSPVGADHQQG